MKLTKRMVCLANSRKRQGRCIAGREITAGKVGPWVRPVSARPNEELTGYERRYADWTTPGVLDVVDVPLLEHRPHSFQRENWLVDTNCCWDKAGTWAWNELDRLTDRTGPLWVNGYSSFCGLDDRVPLAKTATLENSLKLVRVDDLSINVFVPGEAGGEVRRRLQARFSFDGHHYRFWVTDPVAEREYFALPDGQHQVGEAYLTVSLGEPYEGYCYKLVAAVIRGKS